MSKKAEEKSTGMRLNKYLAQAGVCSRRAADEAIEAGRVHVNGKQTKELGTRVDPTNDQVTFDHRPISITEVEPLTIVFNKPRGVVSTLSDPNEKKTLAHLMPERLGRLFPVGRLDKDSQGLLLLTNEGELANRLTHPSFVVEKEYVVSVPKPLNESELRALRQGEIVLSDGHRAKPVQIFDAPRSTSGNRRYIMLLSEGRNREVRELMEGLGVPVKRLKRVRLGPVVLGTIKPGEWRPLTTKERKQLNAILASIGAPVPGPQKDEEGQDRKSAKRKPASRGAGKKYSGKGRKTGGPKWTKAGAHASRSEDKPEKRKSRRGAARMSTKTSSGAKGGASRGTARKKGPGGAKGPTSKSRPGGKPGAGRKKPSSKK